MLEHVMKFFDVPTTCILIAVPALSWYLWRLRASSGLPPGPMPLPVFGNLLSLRVGADEVMMKWWRKYGDLYTIYMGGTRTIVVCGYENLKDLLTQTGDAFLDRPFMYAADKATKGSKGIVLSNGNRWRETRKFSLMAMRDFGVGRQTIREKVIEEANALSELLEAKDGTILNMKPLITNCVSNVICSIVFGRRFEFDEKEFIDAVKMLDHIFNDSGARGLLDFIPWLRFIPGMDSPDQNAMVLETFIRSKIADHRRTYDPSKPARDFIDLYFQLEEGKLDMDKSIFDEDHMYVVIHDLFVAGTETTGTTLYWAILFMVLNPEIQERCRDEIRALLGADGLPELEHRQSLVYVEATLLELQRSADISATGAPRCAAKDTTFKGYHIPKGTAVLGLFHSAHYDPAKWPEPEKFRPERWIDADGKLVHHEGLLAFSLGRRNCLGENLAKVEMFIFFVILLQHFSFSIPEGHPRPPIDGVVGLTRTPHPFEVLVRKID